MTEMDPLALSYIKGTVKNLKYQWIMIQMRKKKTMTLSIIDQSGSL